MAVSKNQINYASAIGVIVLLFTVCLCISSLQLINAAETDCQTVDNQPGLCKRIDHCKMYWDMLPNPTEAQIDILTRANCGWVGRKPKVCCMSEDLTRFQSDEAAGENNSVDSTVSNEVSEYDTGEGTAAKFPLLPTDCGREPISVRISSGNKTKLIEFPWMALLQYSEDGDTSFYCGGMLINEQYVLTAAHCIPGTDPKLTAKLVAVRVGEHTISTDPDFIRGQGTAHPVQIINVEKVIPHPLYEQDSAYRYHDIALIRLKNKASLSSYVRPICLLNKNQTIPHKTRHFVAGWGLTENYEFSDEKLKATVHTEPYESCQQTYAARFMQEIDEQLQICAVGEDGQDACVRDSGGPLMQPIVDKEIGVVIWHASGVIVSGYAVCGRKDVPTIYTNIPAHIDWILANLES